MQDEMREVARRAKPLPPQEVLRDMFEYNPHTGKLSRKALSAKHFAHCKDPRGAAWAANQYNSCNLGREAFGARTRGYFHGRVMGELFLAHRVIWKLVYGTEPEFIDHVNGDRGDNRLENLRSCTHAENSRNYRKPHGSSRYRGVCWVRRDKAWAARISAGRKISLGNFKTELEAARAYDRAARQYHGEFATLNFPNEVF